MPNVSKLDLIIWPGSYLLVIARGQLHCKDIMISLRSFMFYRMELKHEMKRSIKKWKTISNLEEKLNKDFLLCCVLYWSIKQKLSIIKVILTYCLLLAVMAENQLNSPPTIQRMYVSLLQPLLLLSYHHLGLASHGQGPLKQQGFSILFDCNSIISISILHTALQPTSPSCPFWVWRDGICLSEACML